MKFFTLLFGLALVVVASAVLTEEQKAKALEHIRVCRGESGFTEEALRKLKTGDVSDNSNEAKVIHSFSQWDNLILFHKVLMNKKTLPV